MEELNSFFFDTLYILAAAHVSRLILSFHNFPVLFSSSS
jgi:hypothetical protein